MAKKRSLGHVNAKINDHRLKALIESVNQLKLASVGYLGEFSLAGDTLITNDRSIHVSGSDNYLYLTGTDVSGKLQTYYFDVVNGELNFLQSGSSP
jgi:hypothetical protein